ncbi:MAG: hypothetical protein J6Q96_01105 [Bacteroidales bacterium]|nr:hypothetical protein [Bacteroidales bacterium]
MKNSFKVGDKIRGLKGNGYYVTNEDMELAEVIEVDNEGYMKIRILKHPEEKNQIYYTDNDSTKFELIKPKAFTKKDLKDGDIITLRNGKKGRYEGKRTSVDCLLYHNIEDDLTNNGLAGKRLDIVKVERIKETEVVYERDKETTEILDEVEKKYLSSVIKPFRNRIEYIKKRELSSDEFIEIQLSNDCLDLPYFKKGSMYKGMIAENSYSLEELGL